MGGRTLTRAAPVPVLAALLALAAPSGAGAVRVAGGGEPPYTKGTSNTWWFTAGRVGADSRTCLTYFVDGFGGSEGGDGCYRLQGASVTGYIEKGHTALASGHAYGDCAYDQVGGSGGYSPVPVGPVACSATVMDDSAPVASAGVTAPFGVTNRPRAVHLTIHYADSVSFPWPGGSTFDCWRRGGPSGPCLNEPAGHQAEYALDLGCSSPLTNLREVGSWNCVYDLAALPGFRDGAWYYCVVEADYAVPDNPRGPDQLAATSDEANLSPENPAGCGHVIVDRRPPALAVRADHRTARPGQRIRFAARAVDGGGVGQVRWSFGDHGRPGAGASVAHTYRRRGRYTVRASVGDLAGNHVTHTVTIRVRGRSRGSGRRSSHATFRVRVPARATRGQRTLPLRLDATGAGTVRLLLTRGSRRFVRAAVAVPGAFRSRYRLPVPALEAGRYRLRISFTPDGGRRRGRTWVIAVPRPRGAGAAGRRHLAHTRRGAKLPR